MLFSLSSANPIKRKQYTPCKNIVLYFHDIIYNGMNAANATSSIVELHKFLMTLSHWTLTFIQNQLEKHKAFTFMIPKTHTLLGFDRTQVNESQSQLIHDTKGGPKIWQVYSRRGKKVNSG
ncbi:disease resistance response protein, putative [Medicago truncatula]|uniref:Disease resistance response protein, putative n=1 Tax=Medicago truncatula TaxID=3880 RepID=A0A072TEK3_MEDTR|nr:disease resistance response protein, putative [Medicago truncatula]